MNEEAVYDWAARTSAQVVNLHTEHLDKSMQFNAVLGVVLAAMRLLAAEQRETLLKPSKN